MTKELLNELFEYKHGRLVWKFTRSNRSIAGQTAGGNGVNKNGYRRISIDHKSIYEHRAIWVMHYGEIPEGYEIDHKDGNKANNDIDNLRLATKSQNNYNRALADRCRSGYKGVWFAKAKNKWTAQISANKKRISLGYYLTAESARDAYANAAQKLHGQFAKLTK